MNIKTGNPHSFICPGSGNNADVREECIPDWVSDRDALAEVSFDNLDFNLTAVRRWVKGLPVMAVVKANAYGHGLVPVARFYESRQIDYLAVGKFQEAYELRRAGIKSPLLNLGPFGRKEAPEIAALGISQSIFNDDFSVLSDASKTKEPVSIHIKIDTGLGRVGIPYRKGLDFIIKIASLEGIKIAGIFTTLTEEPDFDEVQIGRLLEICRGAHSLGINPGLRHAVSSAGILAFPAGWLDMVRPGSLLYGHYPSKKELRARKIDLRPALALTAAVTCLKDLQPGESVAYHRAFVARKKTRLATVSAGYSDGYPSAVGDKGFVVVHGKRRPIVGIVSSNHITVDVTGIDKIRIGDRVVLIGSRQGAEVSAEEVAGWAETPAYELLIRLNPLLPKRYLFEK